MYTTYYKNNCFSNKNISFETYAKIKNTSLSSEEEKLARLKKFLDKGLITKEEFEQKRRELLDLTVSYNKQEVINKILGYYSGNLTYPNGDKLPVFSEIYLNNNTLEGKYYFIDFGGELLSGKLRDFKIKSNDKLSIQWIDKYGRGWLDINLYKTRFEGKFGVKNNNT